MALAATSYASPASKRFTTRQVAYHDLAQRQNSKAQAAGLSDFDILQL